VAEHTSDAETNLTRCLQSGQGHYTAIYHADDVYASTIIEKEVAFLEAHEDAGGVLTFATLIDRAGTAHKTFLAPSCLDMKSNDAGLFDAVTLFKGVLKNGNFLFCPSAMIRTPVCLNTLKTWRGNLFKSSADLDVWLRIADNSSLGLINEPLLFYRISDTQWTAAYSKTRTHRAHFFLVLDYWIKKPNISAALNQQDIENHQKLKIREDMALTLNHLRQNNPHKAKALSETKVRLLKFTKLGSVMDVKVLVFGLILKSMLFPLVGNILRKILIPRLDNVRL